MLRPSKRLIPVLAGAFALLNVDAVFACSTKDMAYVTAMRSDLRNVLSAEETFRSENSRYTSDLSALGFASSPAVTVTIAVVHDSAYTAKATHSELPKAACFIYVGPVGAARPAAAREHGAEATPWCEGATSLRSKRGLVQQSVVFLLFGLFLATAVFLHRRPRMNWAATALFVETLVLVLTGGGGCPVSMDTSLYFAAIGLLIFADTARRRMRMRGAATQRANVALSL